MPTYNVSKHASASDSNGGTNQTTDALATMAGAFALWSAGDTIVVGTGVYTWKNTASPSTWFSSGTVSNPTTIASYGDGPVTFLRDKASTAGFVYFTGLTRNYISFLGSSGSLMTFDGQAYVDLCNADGTWTVSASGTNEYYYTGPAGVDPVLGHPVNVHIGARAVGKTTYATEGTPGSLAAGEWGFGDNDTLGFSTVYVRLSDGTDPDTKADGDAAVYDSYVYIRNGTDAGFYLGNTPSGNYTFDYVRVTRCYASGILGGSSHDVTITNSRTDHNGWNLWDATIGFYYHDYGVYASGQNLTITNCEMDNNSGHGLHFYPNVSSGLQVDGGSYHDNGKQNGINTTQSKPAILVYNATGPLIQNAVVYSNVGGGILIHNTSDAAIYHNTVVKAETHSTADVEMGIEIRNTSHRALIKNNLVGGNADHSIKIGSGCNDAVVSWNRMDKAITNSGTNTTQSNNTSTGWNSATLFTDYANDDYTLLTGSAAIGATTTNEVPDVGTRTTDNAGNSKSGAFWDQGAFEFSSAPPDAPSISNSASYVVTTAYGDVTVTLTKGTNNIVECTLQGTGAAALCVDNTNVTVTRVV